MPDAIDNFTVQRRCYQGIEKQVYTAGEGPIVVLLHEVPNPYPEVFELALRLVNTGYQVFLPVLFGTPNQPFSTRRAVSHISRLCIQREFAVFASNRSSPVTDWVRSLCLEIQREKQQDGIGLIGMCLTGNFALALLAEPWMLAPVLSQPSLPFPISSRLSKGLHVDDSVLKQAKKRPDLQILGFRFTHDFLCPKARFQTLRDTFGTRFQGIEINSGPFNGYSIPLSAHSVLTKDFVNEQGHPTQEAFRKMVDFLNQQLKK